MNFLKVSFGCPINILGWHIGFTGLMILPSAFTQLLWKKSQHWPPFYFRVFFTEHLFVDFLKLIFFIFFGNFLPSIFASFLHHFFKFLLMSALVRLRQLTSKFVLLLLTGLLGEFILDFFIFSFGICQLVLDQTQI